MQHSILSTPLEVVGWESGISGTVTCNSPCQVTQSKTASDKNTIIFTSSKSYDDLTINSGVTLTNTKTNGHNGNNWSRVIEINNTGTVGTITNQGTISGAGIGIKVKGKVDTIKIESGASIVGNGDNAIQIDGNVGTIANSGSIKGGSIGILAESTGTIQAIIIESGASVQANTWGILVAGKSGNIDIKGDLKTSGGDAIHIESNASVSGTVTIASGALVASVSNSGQVSEKIEIKGDVKGNVENKGQVLQAIEIAGKVGGEITIAQRASVGSGIKIEQGANIAKGISNSGNINQGITIAKGANLQGKIENKQGATIAGGITNKSDKTLVVNSAGKIEKNVNGETITNNGSGGVEVEAFAITGNSSGTPQKLVIGGSGDARKNKVENITVDTTVKLEKIQEEGLNSLVAGVSKDNVASISHMDSEIKINKTGNIEFRENSNKVGRTVTKALNVASNKRANFAETTMNNSLKGLSHSLKQQMRAIIGDNSLDRDAMYANAGLNDLTTSFTLPNPRTSAAFMLPYYTKHSSQMQEGWNEATGDTKGIVVGYTRLIGEDFLGVYAGSDKMKLSASNPNDNNAMSLENNTYYAGAKYASVFQKIEDHALYYRIDGKFAWTQNKITETIGGEQATGRPSTIGYGLGINVGANLSLSPTTTLVPEMGFAYEGGIMDAYTIKINQHTKTYESEPTHFYNTTLSLGWIENWNAFVATQLEGGMRYNFNHKARTTLEVKGVGTTTTKLNTRETFSPFINSSVIFTFQPNFVLSLNYLGVFDNQTKNNTFYSQFAYLW